ncbi:hypothetical protein SAMD00019534_058560 [Acytostelium subglobosum LB1]|uniref:hypothetical protein n=1 Tax=Acytostelium subglobosum LB1 TaxID=1410327 RepID=UPI0006448D40|nr:hypothetical protein SAMD00019534_058560 [Acytostelium subglobosum LB1]GAM22681.1 hypothetical protein SAMD00019534_058560 [Acytostelium subglobosum LB1]|eukprot:XP_012754801.1 hypothetical protein SAMD00019534_058560 [Acytostelium subglobosum LB1]
MAQTNNNKIAMFSAKKYWDKHFESVSGIDKYKITNIDAQLNENTASLAKGHTAVCPFVNDVVDDKTLHILHQGGTRVLLLRSTGFNHVNLKVAQDLGMTVMHVPGYSPASIAEYAVAMMLTLNRRLIKASRRVFEGNFELSSLDGFEMNGKTVGVCGTGNIGMILCRILMGFGCKVIAYDVRENPECIKMGVKYVSLEEIWAQSDIISLHVPLLKDTKHMINPTTIDKMKNNVMIINTSRGGLVDTKAVIKGIKSGKIGYLGLDVYEEEADLFFEDKSETIIQDDKLARLTTFCNVLVTGHQAWFTNKSLDEICKTTINNFASFLSGNATKANVVEYKPISN